MQTRSELMDDFLSRAGWHGAKRAPLAGDASFRRYERVLGQDRQAVLMDAPPAKEDVRPFMQVGEYLQSQKFSAPKIYAHDVENGFLLLEDLGDDLFTKLLAKSPQKEEALYLAASDILADLYCRAEKADYSAFPAYDEARLLKEVHLLSEWFLPTVLGNAASEAVESYANIWQKLISTLPALRNVLVLRDYHADNLLWLPKRNGLARVGLLDFQDGVIGSPAYDVVSFLEDARRDVKEDTVQRVLTHYLNETRILPEHFAAAYALLGAQRNCKIIGIFIRLAVRDGKQQYINYLPRVWKHLERDVLHPALKPLADWLDTYVKHQWRGAIEVANLSLHAVP